MTEPCAMGSRSIGEPKGRRLVLVSRYEIRLSPEASRWPATDVTTAPRRRSNFRYKTEAILRRHLKALQYHQRVRLDRGADGVGTLFTPRRAGGQASNRGLELRTATAACTPD